MTLSHLTVPLFTLPLLLAPESRPPPEPLEATQYVRVVITSSGYDPASLTVRHGDVVQFVQMDEPAHNVEFHNAPQGAEFAPEYSRIVGNLEVFHPMSPTPRVGPYLIGAGRTYEIRIGEDMPEGAYTFGCSRHAKWRGLMVIDDGDERP